MSWFQKTFGPDKDKKTSVVPATSTATGAGGTAAASGTVTAQPPPSASGIGYRNQLKVILDSFFLERFMPKELISLIFEYTPRLAFTVKDMSQIGLMLSNDGLTVEYTLDTDKWSSVRTEYPLSTHGVTEYEVLIDSFDRGAVGINSWGLAIGLVTTETMHDIEPASFCVGNKQSYSYLIACGQKCHASGAGRDFVGGSSPKPVTAGTGDRVRVRVDHNRKTIDFFVNGVSLGPGFSTVHDPIIGEAVQWPADSLFYPCVSLTLPKSKVSIVNS